MDVRMAAALAGAIPNVAEFCRRQQISRQTFYKWRRRFAAEGVPGLAERSRAPHHPAGGCSPQVADAVVRWRKRLLEDGCDHGADSIRWQLQHDATLAGQAAPSRATIWRLLAARGLITPQPRKRPHSSLRRFSYARPNECWQADWTGWTLADGRPVAIAGVLDDCSRVLGGLQTAAGDADTGLVWSTFLQAVACYGVPARSLTDNGLVYSGRRRGTEVAYETNLRALGVAPICSSPHHPQTCGKIERFWQTLKRWLAAHDPPATVPDLQRLLDAFHDYYNHHRPHRALGTTPAQAFAATPAARPHHRPLPAPVFVHARPHHRPLPAPVFVHARTVDAFGTVSVGPYRVNVGAAWHGHHVHTVRDGDHIAVFSGPHLIRQLTADPSRRYQPAAADATPKPDVQP